jgi:hypothetical protein
MKKNVVFWIFITIALMFTAFYLYSMFRKKPEALNKRGNTEQPTAYEPKFRYDGDLVLLKQTTEKTDTLARIMFEAAKTEYDITTGLMYRKQMDENKGMLFFFERDEMRSFWMKNTILPLDIIFINSKMEVVTIQRNTTPFSEKSVPSSAPAQYVLEINAGMADKLGLQEGHKLSFRFK